MMKNTIIAALVSVCFCSPSIAGESESVEALRGEAANLFFQKQQYDLAWTLNKQAVLLAEKVQDTYPEKLVVVLEQQATFYGNLKEFKQAQNTLLRVIKIRENNPTLEGRHTAATLQWLANLYIAQNDHKQAEAALLKAIAILQSTYGETDTALLGNFVLLGQVHLAQEHLDEAEIAFKHAWSLSEKQGHDNAYWQQGIFRGLEKIYRKTKREELAKETANKFANVKPTTYISSITNVKPEAKVKGVKLKSDSCQNPQYPREAIRYELQGPTQLRFLIADNGDIVTKYISKSSGWKILDDAAIDAISLCKFEPSSYNDKPVTSWFGFQYNWKLGIEGPDIPPVELVQGSCKSRTYDVVGKDAKQWLVRLRFLIDPQGKTYGIKIEDSSKDPAVDNDIIALLGRCEFKPTMVNGAAVGNSGVMRFALTSDVK